MLLYQSVGTEVGITHQVLVVAMGNRGDDEWNPAGLRSARSPSTQRLMSSDTIYADAASVARVLEIAGGLRRWPCICIKFQKGLVSLRGPLTCNPSKSL